MSNSAVFLRPVLVSVCIVTYNQSLWIRECIESLIFQDADFDYEIIVGDDCSNDGTAEIVQEYSERYPELITSVVRKKNLGAVANLVDVYKRARGQYIAHMDGDDLAFPNKLKMQVQTFKDNRDIVICSHDVVVIDKKSKVIANSFRRHKEGLSHLSDLYACLPFFAHSSKMFLNDKDFSFFENLTPDSIDIEIHVWQAKKGHIFHIEQKLGAYRALSGMTAKNSRVNMLLPNATRRVFDAAIKDCSKKSDAQILKKHFAKSILNYGYQGAIAGCKVDFVQYVRESVSIKVISFVQIMMFFSTYVPSAAIFFSGLRKKIVGYVRLKLK